MSYPMIIYQVLTNPKLRIIQVDTGKIWNFSTSALASDTPLADSCQVLTRDSYIAGMPISIPATLPSGQYDLLIYDVATMLETSEPTIGRRIDWSGVRLMRNEFIPASG